MPMPSVIMLSVVYPKGHNLVLFTERRYAKCHYAEWLSASPRAYTIKLFTLKITLMKNKLVLL
jgi:hypothetical protein